MAKGQLLGIPNWLLEKIERLTNKSPKLLWENSNKMGNFVAQTITLTEGKMSDYDVIELVYSTNGYQAPLSQKLFVDTLTGNPNFSLNESRYDGIVYVSQRSGKIDLNANTILFYECQQNGTQQNGRCVPVAVIGYKF